MVELQSCATLVKAVNASALSAIEQEVKGDSVSINIVAEISAELQRERQKNVELMERISILEAQIQEKNKATVVADEQGNYQHSAARGIKKFKRQKIEIGTYQVESGNTVETQMALQHKPDNEAEAREEMDPANGVVNWMSMEDSQVLCVEKLKDSDSVADFHDTDCDEEFDDNYDDDDDNDDMENGQSNGELDENTKASNLFKDNLPDCLNEQLHKQSLENFSGHRHDPTTNTRQAVQENQRKNCILSSALLNKSEVKMDGEEVIKEIGGCRAPLDVPSSGCGSTSQHRKPLKVAFCPKEVKGIIESNALLEKNAQSHTIRKIIVFASLGIKHGCEDMYELDFNHFSIMKKGEPYVSPRNPGEHVLYENPGVRRKVFYPNRQNLILCPVQILEEEKAMRPSDASCPSCLFLCIKYGGRTRNLPQNEYVRQRMGRNKLKSFGPLMCRMAMLVHIRSGSFFFKALGITLLFMAGFPDDLVQSETKYQNLDLLQKYCRTDEDAKGEELFLPHPITCDQRASTEPQNITRKPLPAKSRGRKHSNSVNKSQNLKKNLKQSTPSTSSTAPTQFGLTGYSPAHTYAMSMPSQISKDASRLSNLALRPSSTTANHNSYHMLPPQPTSAFVPLMYWPAPPNVFAPPGPYASTFGYQSFPSSASYMSFHTQPYYTHPSCSSSLPKLLEGSGKNDAASEESDSDSDSSSGSDEQKKRSAI